MAFVIICSDRKPLADAEGNLILLMSRNDARACLKSGQRIEPYVPSRHCLNTELPMRYVDQPDALYREMAGLPGAEKAITPASGGATVRPSKRHKALNGQHGASA
jgi:hypothetical protein